MQLSFLRSVVTVPLKVMLSLPPITEYVFVQDISFLHTMQSVFDIVNCCQKVQWSMHIRTFLEIRKMCIDGTRCLQVAICLMPYILLNKKQYSRKEAIICETNTIRPFMRLGLILIFLDGICFEQRYFTRIAMKTKSFLK